MANTTKSKTTTTKETKTTEAKTDVVKEDKVTQLEKTIKEQQEQIAQLMQLMQGNVTIPQINKEDISADDEILVISLTPNKLNLIGDNGVVLFSFDEMYEEQYIDYASLKEIVRINRDMARNGRFYILDERVVNKLRLKNHYKNILTPDQLKTLINTKVDKAIQLYKLANPTQQATIIEMVKQSKFRGDNVDYNLLRELGELSGVNLIDAEDATQIDVK
jgi:hypothetical protein